MPQILVKNVLPQLTLLEIGLVTAEGATATLTGSYMDAGTLDTHQVDIDWGDGTPVQTVDISGGTFSITHIYADQPTAGTSSGPVTIGVRLRDDDGGLAFQTLATTVTNVNPVITDLSITPLVDENNLATLIGTYMDAGVNDTHSLQIDWGDGSAIETVTVSGGTFSVTHRYLDDALTDDDADLVIVDVTLDDGDLGTTSDSVMLIVRDVAPVVSNLQLSQSAINEGDTVTLTGDYSDVGTLDTHELRIHWNDRSRIPSFGESGGHFSGTPNFSRTTKPTGAARPNPIQG